MSDKQNTSPQRESDSDRNYSLAADASNPIQPVELPDRPPIPKQTHRIGLIGCGGISTTHLQAYQKAGFEAVAFSDLDPSKAIKQRDTFFPNATVYPDYESLLRDADVDVVDIATPAAPRPPIIEAALRARRHVLSQKPFVLDLNQGRRLCDLADKCGCKLAVNQNGRWAPHLSHIREAVRAGLLGDVVSVNVDIHWNHNWIVGTPFDQMEHVVLEDFAIHWFDFVTSIVPGLPERVCSSVIASPEQRAAPPLIATTVLTYKAAQVVLNFDADTIHGAADRTAVRGTQGAAYSVGESLTQQSLTVHTANGWYRPTLHGDWFSEGFIGTMAELLCAVEQDRQPLNNARDNLTALQLSAMAIKAAS